MEEYLLKPVDEDELLCCMRKVWEALDRQRQEQILHNAQEDVAREELLRDILFHRQSRQELEKGMAQYGISFGADPGCVAILADQGAEGGQGDFQEKGRDFLRDTSLYIYRTAMDNRTILISQGMEEREWVGKLSGRNEKLRVRYGEVLSRLSIESMQKKGENPPAEYFLMLAEVGNLEGIQGPAPRSTGKRQGKGL